jgi:hypothetical protein
LVLRCPGVEQARLGKDGASRGRSGIEQLKLELDRDLIVIDVAMQRVEAKLERWP